MDAKIKDGNIFVSENDLELVSNSFTARLRLGSQSVELDPKLLDLYAKDPEKVTKLYKIMARLGLSGIGESYATGLARANIDHALMELKKFEEFTKRGTALFKDTLHSNDLWIKSGADYYRLHSSDPALARLPTLFSFPIGNQTIFPVSVPKIERLRARIKNVVRLLADGKRLESRLGSQFFVLVFNSILSGCPVPKTFRFLERILALLDGVQPGLEVANLRLILASFFVNPDQASKDLAAFEKLVELRRKELAEFDAVANKLYDVGAVKLENGAMALLPEGTDYMSVYCITSSGVVYKGPGGSVNTEISFTISVIKSGLAELILKDPISYSFSPVQEVQAKAALDKAKLVDPKLALLV